jgi:hypothetical protein
VKPAHKAADCSLIRLYARQGRRDAVLRQCRACPGALGAASGPIRSQRPNEYIAQSLPGRRGRVAGGRGCSAEGCDGNFPAWKPRLGLRRYGCYLAAFEAELEGPRPALTALLETLRWPGMTAPGSRMAPRTKALANVEECAPGTAAIFERPHVIDCVLRPVC